MATDNETKKYPRMDLEDKDIDIKAIVKFMVILVVTTVIIYIGTVALFKGFEWWEAKNDPPVNELYLQRAKEPPKPILQTNSTQSLDLKEFREKENKILKEGDEAIKKIPIEQAIDKVVQKGFAVRPEAESQNFKDKAEYMPTYQSSGRSFERRLR
jgi:hypothetical protein